MSEVLKNSNRFKEPTFWNIPLDKGRLKSFVSWFLKNYGEQKTLRFLEDLKILGFGYATKAGISLGIEDLKIPPNKLKLLSDAEFVLTQSNFSYRKGETTGIEKVQRFIETWNETSEALKQEVVRYFEKTDILNPVYMMAFSGARGNLSQVRQLVGMRGLMSDPQGKIIDFPIQSNFREGLTLTEYLISTYGARKGIVDTALRTATAGYLTRRLVDVAQHVIVSKFDCGSQRGIFLFDMKEGLKTIYSFQNRLTGRVLAQDLYFPNLTNEESSSLLAQTKREIRAYRNQEITPELAEAISKMTKKALVRSPLTCETRKLVCQLCYGWSLATSKLVSIGETVGVIAGQSIGEPGTQLTMRTFHTGGVFAANVAQQINAPFAGRVEYASPISGSCIRTPNGDIAFFTKAPGTLFLQQLDSNVSLEQMRSDPKNFSVTSKEDLCKANSPTILKTYKIPAFTILFARHGQFMEQNSILAQISAATTGQQLTQTIEQTIYSSFEGEVYYNQIDVLEDIDEKYGERISKAEDWSKVWVLSAKILQNQLSSSCFPKVGDFVSPNSVLNQIQWKVTMSEKSTLDLFSTTAVSSLTSSRQEYSYLLKNQSPCGPLKVEETELLHLAQEPQSQHTKKFKILSKYTLKMKFQESNKFKVKNEKNTEPVEGFYTKELVSYSQKLNVQVFQKEFEIMKTSFSYPYDFLVRAKSLNIIKQTFISLPFLQSGSLKTWLNTHKERSFKPSKAKISESFHKAPTAFFVKKLNLNPRFRYYNSLKSNLFHPLVLTNMIPFTLEEKSIQSWLNRKSQKSVLNLFQLKKLRKSTLTLAPFQLKFPQQNMFDNQKNESNLKSISFSKCLMKKSSSLTPESFTRHKFEKCNLKTPFLLLKLQNLNYSKFGYFASIVLNCREKSQIVSVLPLNQNSNLPLKEQNLYLSNQNKENLHVFYKTTNISENLNLLNLYGLKNSYQWSSKPINSFFLIPGFSQNESPGLFDFQNVCLFQQKVGEKLNKLNVKSLKQRHLNSLKHLTLLNLSHSQVSKKLRKDENLTILEKKAFQRILGNPQSGNVNNKLKMSMCMNLKAQNLVLLGVQGSHSGIAEQKPGGLHFGQKPGGLRFWLRPNEKPEKNYSKFKFKNTLFSIQTSYEIKEEKINFLTKKRNIDLKTPKHLHIDFKSDQKNAIDYNELYWIPEEQYHFECFRNQLDLFQENSKKTLFISKNSKSHSKSSKVLWYQSNLQGFKKPIHFELEGFLKVQKFSQTNPKGLNILKSDAVISFGSDQKKRPFKKFGFKSHPVFLKGLKSNLQGHFLNYLKSKKFLNKKVRLLPLTLGGPTRVIANLKMPQSFFTSLPFFTDSSLKLNFSEIQNQKALISGHLKPIKKKLNSISLTLKPGWVYKTENLENFFSSHKQMMDPGHLLVDDITFEQHKVFMEILSISPKKINSNGACFVKSFNFQNGTEKLNKINLSMFIKNKKPRFSNTKIQKSAANKDRSFYLLLRPCYHRIFPTPTDMKIQLYEAMQTNRFKNLENSYFYYKQYFLSNLNIQSQPLKLISQFSSYDLEVNTIHSVAKFLELKSLKINLSVKKVTKSSLKLSGNQKFFKEKNWKSLKASSIFLFSKTSRNLQISQLKQPYKKDPQSKELTSFAISNFPRSFISYEISLKSQEENFNEFSISKIQFKSTELQNLLIKNISTTSDSTSFNKHYLNSLILGYQSKKQSLKSEKQSSMMISYENKGLSRIPKALYLKSFLYDFTDLPFFEYSLEKTYNFFANQRLFASSFYKYQFKSFLKVPVLKDLMVNQQLFKNQKFIQKFSEQHNFGSSFYDSPFFKNYMIFKNPKSGPSRNNVVGFTNFYSSSEGEILKDYSNEQDLITLQKGFNINLDRANLLERQNQQLILTKDDLVTFPFYFNDFYLETNLSSSQNKIKQSQTCEASNFFESENTKDFFKVLVKSYQRFQRLETQYFKNLDLKTYSISDFTTIYKNKNYLLKQIKFGLPNKQQKLRLGNFVNSGDPLYSDSITVQSGQVIHLNKDKITLRKAEFFSISPKAILHTYNGHCLTKNSPVMTLPFETLKTGDIVQGIPKVEQYLEARTTIQGRLFLNSLPVLLYAIYQRYSLKLEMEKAVRQSFLKIQQILVDGVQRVYRSQGVGIADKHLEIIVRQMTSKVKIIHGGQTGFVSGELIDLEFVERINKVLMVKIRYEPVVLGITRASLEVDSFLSAASFQQTTKVLTRAALENKKDFLKGLKENLLVGNLLPAGTGYILPK